MNEDALYAAYAKSIDVPPMWDELERRIRSRRSYAWLAAAAALILVVATIVFRRTAAPPVADVAGHYRAAIAKLDRGTDSPLAPPLTAAIAEAERAAARAPEDPVAVTRVVAAYDAKLQLLRTTIDD